MWLLGFGVVRALFPLVGGGVAIVAAQHGFGLLNVVSLPGAVTAVAAILLLDVAKYAEHRTFHRVRLLWRVHRMHHTDVDFDVTLGLRFHPIEVVLSTCWSVSVIGLLGLPVAAVAIWHVVLLANAAFAHGNVRMPGGLDRALRLVTVTPDMHRVHHSAAGEESGSNLGSLFPWWDWMLGTYVAAPAAGIDAMRTGIDDYRHAKHQTLPWMLAHPFLPTRQQGDG